MIYANQSTLDYTGMSAADILSPNFRGRIFHPDDLERLARERKTALEHGFLRRDKTFATKSRNMPARPGARNFTATSGREILANTWLRRTTRPSSRQRPLASKSSMEGAKAMKAEADTSLPRAAGTSAQWPTPALAPAGCG